MESIEEKKWHDPELHNSPGNRTNTFIQAQQRNHESQPEIINIIMRIQANFENKQLVKYLNSPTENNFLLIFIHLED